ncbi:hypothetical protein K523DRAFT_412838, partial [Schizophyllum commune Tattone D]
RPALPRPPTTSIYFGRTCLKATTRSSASVASRVRADTASACACSHASRIPSREANNHDYIWRPSEESFARTAVHSARRRSSRPIVRCCLRESNCGCDAHKAGLRR